VSETGGREEFQIRGSRMGLKSADCVARGEWFDVGFIFGGPTAKRGHPIFTRGKGSGLDVCHSLESLYFFFFNY
jgi:hypothetical protein